MQLAFLKNGSMSSTRHINLLFTGKLYPLSANISVHWSQLNLESKSADQDDSLAHQWIHNRRPNYKESGCYAKTCRSMQNNLWISQFSYGSTQLICVRDVYVLQQEPKVLFPLPYDLPRYGKSPPQIPQLGSSCWRNSICVNLHVLIQYVNIIICRFWEKFEKNEAVKRLYQLLGVKQHQPKEKKKITKRQ